MVIQSLAHIHSSDASSYNVGKVALNEELAHHDGSPNAVEEALSDDDNDDTAPLGLGVNTRNYQALMDNFARRQRTSSMVLPSRAIQRRTVAVLPQDQDVKKSKEYMVDDKGKEDEEDADARDETVWGHPVDTRNYEAIVRCGRPVCSAPGAMNLLNRRATVDIMPRAAPVSNVAESSLVALGTSDNDVVMGLPLSTEHHVAYLADESGLGLKDAGQRHQRYSNVEKEHRESDPCRSSSQCGTASQNSFMTAPNNSIQLDPRISCFDTRRASNAAYVPYSSWVYIQHGALKTWKRYFAVLSGMEFKFSKGAGHSPKGLGLLTAVRRAHDVRYGIWLELDGDASLLVRCSSVEEFEQWLNAAEKAIGRLNSQNMSSYTLTASERHEGYLFKQEKNKTWKRCFFVVGTDGYIECRDSEQDPPDRKWSGYIKAVSFADHANGLAIQLSTGVYLVCYADSYDEQMLWFGAISAAVTATGKTAQANTSVKSCYVETALLNHAGWLYKQAGILKGWKRQYFTLHGTEFAFAKDTNSETVLCDYAVSVDEWSEHANGLMIQLASGRAWKVYADSYETAKRWRSVIRSACRVAETFNLKKYLTSRRRKKLKPVYGGWLTEVRKTFRLRRYYVIDGTTLGVANDVDNQLRRLGNVVDVGSTRDHKCGLVFTLANGTAVKVICDSLADSKCWYECLNFSLK